MKIGVLEPLGVSPEQLHQLTEPLCVAGHELICYKNKAADTQELIARSLGCEIVVIANTPYPDSVVRAALSLKMLDVAFTGYDHVGKQACMEKGVTICNAAGYSTQAVAELAVGMVIALLRNLAQAERRARNGETSQGLVGAEIAGKTVGIVGTGAIGTRTAKLFSAFGANVIAYSRSVRPEMEALGARYLSLEELMAQADIVSVHLPADRSTYRLIGPKMIERMKPTALLINCARGAVVDGAALADALNQGRIAGAGIDVFDHEPPLEAGDPLLTAKNTLLTPHVGFLTREAMLLRAKIAFQNIEAYLAGRPINVCQCS